MTKSYKNETESMTTHSGARGFTLIELMVIVVIISILAAIAIPSYRQYAVMNAEREAQAKLLQLQLELERWRSKALSYQGFQPKVVDSGTGDDESDNKTIYVPDGSDAANYSYVITLVDANTGNTLAPTSTGYSTAGSSWRMLAEPNASFESSDAHIIMISSTGVRCKSKDRTVTSTDEDCGTGQKEW